MSLFIIAGPEEGMTFGETIGCFFDKRNVHVWGNYVGTWALRHGNTYNTGMSQEKAEKEANLRLGHQANLIFVPYHKNKSRIITLDEL